MKYFDSTEFVCAGEPCFHKMDKGFLEQIDLARSMSKVAWKINSSWRSYEHNKYVGGKATSSHLKGLAVDIHAPTSRHIYEIVTCCLMAGFTRIGVGSNFVHVDSDAEKPQNVIWTY